MRSTAIDIRQTYEHGIPFHYWMQCIENGVFDNNTMLKCSQELHEISEALGDDIDELIYSFNRKPLIYQNRRTRREAERKRRKR